jgi:hypothetical protein
MLTFVSVGGIASRKIGAMASHAGLFCAGICFDPVMG